MASTFSTYTKEELLKKLKNQKLFLLIQGFVIILMLIFGVFSTVENGMSFHTFLPLFFIPMLFVMVYELKKIKQELSSRT
jgi:membrane-associated HD superfamily phosphohydrolase